MNAADVRKVIRRQHVTQSSHSTQVWVGLGHLPADRDPDDYTLPEITHPYVTKRALLAAIDNGSAFLPEHEIEATVVDGKPAWHCCDQTFPATIDEHGHRVFLPGDPISVHLDGPVS